MTKSPQWLTTYVESLDIQPLTKYRSDCPVCGKSNTFSVTDDGVQRMWFCFHADCNVKGRTNVKLTKEFATHALIRKLAKPTEEVADKNFQPPHTFVSLSRNRDAEMYVRRMNSYDAYLSGRVDIRYDFQRHRVVYMVKDGRKVVDAVGRALNNVRPKWYRYGKSQTPFVCGNHGTAFVVEDCASACAISNKVTGLALLGTNLLQEHVRVLQEYERVYIALDKDATDKALDMVRRLYFLVPTSLAVLQHDLKNMMDDERDEYIEERIA